MNLPKISVVTVCYNSAKTLERTIASVLSQDYPNLEYLIIDGGSTDGTVDIIRRYESQLAYWCSEVDKGIYDAMNKGIRLAKGEWIHLLNADDWYIERDVWSRVIPHFYSLKVNYMSMVHRWESGRERLYRFKFRRWPLYYSAYLPHPALVVHRSQYDAVGLYNTDYRMAADHDMIMRLVHRYPGNFIDIPFVVMQQGGLSEAHRGRALKEMQAITEKNGLPAFLAKFFYHIKLRRLRLIEYENG